MNRARHRLPVLVALAAMTVAGLAGWQLIVAGAASLPLTLFCVTFVGVVSLFGTRRLVNGPKLRGVLDYSLAYPQAKLATNPTMSDLVQRLESLGYSIVAHALDETDSVLERAAQDENLLGHTYRLTQRTTKSVHAGLTLRFAPIRAEARNGTVLVEAADYINGPYNEMAMYAIRELAEIFPELTYQTTGSALEPDAADTLATLLPDRPSHVIANA